jgi:ZIP family zinc transporter
LRIRLLAILLHNIEGSLQRSLWKSGVGKWNSFRIALLSGLVEPIGALAAAVFLKSFRILLPGALAFAGGVMMFITLDELIPAAREHGHQHYTAVGIIIGSLFVFILSGLLGV